MWLLTTTHTDPLFIGKGIDLFLGYVRLEAVVGGSSEQVAGHRTGHLIVEPDTDVPTCLTDRTLDACGIDGERRLVGTLAGASPRLDSHFYATYCQLSHTRWFQTEGCLRYGPVAPSVENSDIVFYRWRDPGPGRSSTTTPSRSSMTRSAMASGAGS